jgi:uncharacterized membrane protein
MQRIPLTAHAECTDGPSGDLSGLIVRAETRALEYYVVGDTTPGHAIERLVPRARVDASSLTLLHLNCTLAELGKMQPLSEQQYALTGPPKSGSSGKYGLVDAERAPDGTGVLRASQVVEAKNGKIGKLSGIVVDDAGLITHFYTRLDKGSNELFLPVSAVWYVDRTNVYLQLDKHQLESLPPVPAAIDKSGEVAHKHMELVGRVYDTSTGAGQALEQLTKAQDSAEHPIKIRESAVLVREGDGPAKLSGGGQTAAGKGAGMGVAAGGLLAMLGPVGLVAGAVAGGAVGAFAGSRVDLGFPETFLKGLEERLKPDHSALIVLVEHELDEDPTEVRAVLDGAISHSSMVDKLVQDMLAAEQPAVPA